MTDPRPFLPLAVPLQGTNLVNASAGTGKTYAITTLFIRLLLERQLPVSDILVVTFTEAATAELRARIRARLQDALRAFRACEIGQTSSDPELCRYAESRRLTLAADQQQLRLALQNVDEAPISTIHGFCHRMLHDSAFESGVLFDAELVTDLSPLRDEVLHDYWANTMTDAAEAMVRRIRAANLLPGGARSLAIKAASNPDMPVLPEAIVDLWQLAAEQARDAWDREGIEQLITAGEWKPKFAPSYVKRWADQLDTFFSELPPEPPRSAKDLPKGFEHFSGQAMAKRSVGTPPVHPFLDTCAPLVSASKAFRTRGPEVVRFKKELVDYLRDQLPRRKRAAGLISFDDMLQLLCKALTGAGGEQLAQAIRSQYQAALIDEFQDTDPVQFAIFKAVYGTTNQPLFLIGDPKQAIYAFRGADVFAFLRAVATTDNDTYTMGVNWRSDPTLLTAVSELFGQNERCPRPFVLKDIVYPPVAPRPEASDCFEACEPFGPAPLEVLFVPRDEGDKKLGKMALKGELPSLVAADISMLIRQGGTLAGRPVQAQDIAVLTRTNQQGFEMQAALRELHIPAVVLGDQNVFLSPEATDLWRVLRAVIEPTNAHELRKAITTELLGVNGNQLAEMETDPAAWDRWAGLFRHWNELWAHRGFVQMFRAMMTDSQLQQRLLGLNDGERRVTNLLHLAELLHTTAKESHLGPAGLLRWLSLQRSSATAAADQAEIRLESDASAVTISTIHKAKGLEYPIVYCPYVWDGRLLFSSDQEEVRFHDEAGRLTMDLGSRDFDAHLARAELYEAFAENLRLLYVALTRAKHRCMVVWGMFNEVDRSAFGYLLHPPAIDGERELTIDHLKGRLAELTDLDMIGALTARGDACGGAIGWRLLERGTQGVPVPRASGAAQQALDHRRAQQPVATWWRMTSYSSLAKGKPGADLDQAEGRDRDEVSEAVSEAIAVSQPAAGSAESTEPARIVLADFPRGAKAGTFLHEVLEHLDFADLGAIEPLVQQTLGAYRYESGLADMVGQAVHEVLHTPLRPGADGFTLSQISRSKRLDELQFHLPLASAATGWGGSAASHERSAAQAGTKASAEPSLIRSVTPERIAAVFEQPPTEASFVAYARSLRRLRFVRLHGFLKGYIDLICEHDGRYYVVDYKSNFLGETLDDYGQPSLVAAMREGHYFLQYYLYAIAVHRYLGRRLPRYDYDEHFGGVLYLFLRGMSPTTGVSRGVFFEKPPLQRLQALSDVLAGKAPGRTA